MTDALLSLRKSGLGATDASAILGLNPWRTPLQVWAEKRGLAPGPEQSISMRRGLALEPLIADLYAEATGRALWAPETVYHHAEHDQLLCSPDRIASAPTPFGVELKSVLFDWKHEWGEPGTDQVPQHYLIQCLHSMLVMGAPRWDLAALIGDRFVAYTIARDEELLASLRDRELAWWETHMVDGKEPAPMAQDNGWLSTRYPANVLALKEADTAAYAAASDLKLAKIELEAAQERKDEAEARLKAFIADTEGVQGEGWRATWKANKNGVRVFRFAEKDAA